MSASATQTNTGRSTLISRRCEMDKENDNTKQLTSRIHLARVRTGLNQKEFAKRLGVSKSTQLRYENGQTSPPFDYLERVASEYGVDSRWLMTGECAEALRMPVETWCALLEAVAREIPRWRADGNAPGHCHKIAGVWDDDNGDLSGKPCAWCIAWNAASDALNKHRRQGEPT